MANLPEDIIRDAAESGELITKTFGNEVKRTTNIEYERWCTEILYKRKTKKRKSADFTEIIKNIHKP